MQKPPTPTQHSEAIIRLASIARENSGGGRSAARILLSAYNQYEWQFSAGDVARFDDDVLDAVLTVLHGRARLGEPHRFVDVPQGDPERVFRELWALWAPDES